MPTKPKTTEYIIKWRATLPIDGGGLRLDQGKRRLDLLPIDALEAVADVMTFGARKYQERNWERGMNFSKAYGPLWRHLADFASGRRRDKESGLPVMAHVVCNAIFLLAWELRGLKQYDDIEPYLRASRGTNETQGATLERAAADQDGVGHGEDCHHLHPGRKFHGSQEKTKRRSGVSARPDTLRSKKKR